MKKIVVGNWKMNPSSLKEAENLFEKIVKLMPRLKNTEVVVCPPVLFIEELEEISKKIKIGAQNVSSEKEGSYTGEVSAKMLKNMRVKHVIVGHSERRKIGETDIDVNRKIKATLSSSLVPVLCIGEEVRDEDNKYFDFIKTQLRDSLENISKSDITKIIVAYEPVWAIGTGASAATATEFFEMGIFIKKVLSDKFGLKVVSKIRIIYGGSVDEKNAEEFIKIGKADGFLIGRASLNAEKFSKIIKTCEVSNR
ncbi:MAG: triose-phosphate isomerase [Patescibacteria group bacterium]